MEQIFKTGIDELDNLNIFNYGQVSICCYWDKWVILNPELITISFLKNIIQKSEYPVAIVDLTPNCIKLKEYAIRLTDKFHISDNDWNKLVAADFEQLPFLNLSVTSRLYKINKLEQALKKKNVLPRVVVLIGYPVKDMADTLLSLHKLAKELNISIIYFTHSGDFSKEDKAITTSSETTVDEKIKCYFKHINNKEFRASDFNICFMEDYFTYDTGLNETVLLKMQTKNIQGKCKICIMNKKVINVYAEYPKN